MIDITAIRREGEFENGLNESKGRFTGTLQQMTRTQAIGLVHSLNGHCQSSVTSKQISWFVVSILSRCLMILSIQKGTNRAGLDCVRS